MPQSMCISVLTANTEPNSNTNLMDHLKCQKESLAPFKTCLINNIIID